LGGFGIGALTLIADFVGCIGSGASVTLAVTITFQYFETIAKEASRYGL